MKRFHVHVAVDDLGQSIGFYSNLFGAPPVVLKDDYAKWMLDDPKVNFAISTRGGKAGVDRVHLIEFHHHRPPGGEGGRVVEHDVTTVPVVVGQGERVERHVLDHLERADAELGLPAGPRRRQVIDPVADVMQARHQLVDE